MNTIPAILWTVAMKATLILIAACLAALALQRASASARRLVWALAVISLIALPALIVTLPPIGVSKPMVSTARIIAAPVRIQPGANEFAAPVESPKTSAAPISWIAALWAAGVLAVLGRLAAGTARMWWMVRSARPIEAPAFFEELARDIRVRRKISIVESDQAAMPMTWGAFRPVILLPAHWREWPAERTRLVLAHELIHVRQHDCLLQMLAQSACALYWFHPLAWLAAAGLRKERERACDDGVLDLGVSGPHYAEHLLDLVRTLKANERPWSLAVAMAQHSHLESRLVALLDSRLNRKQLTRRATALAGIAALCLIAPLASLRAQATKSTGTLSGVVYDPSGAVIPNATILATNLDTHAKETALANAAGEYTLRSIPAGSYNVEVSLPGFKQFHRNVVLGANETQRLDITMDLGGITERLEVTAQKPAGQTPHAAAPRRIRVGGNVAAARLLYKALPIYPEAAKQQGIEGPVLMQAIISKEGTVLSLSVVTTADPELAKAAVEAVQQWRYQPTLLNGQPVEVVTTITVDFRLQP